MNHLWTPASRNKTIFHQHNTARVGPSARAFLQFLTRFHLRSDIISRANGSWCWPISTKLTSAASEGARKRWSGSASWCSNNSPKGRSRGSCARWTSQLLMLTNVQHSQGAVGRGGLTDVAEGVGADAVEVGESVGGVAWHRVAELDQRRVEG